MTTKPHLVDLAERVVVAGNLVTRKPWTKVPNFSLKNLECNVRFTGPKVEFEARLGWQWIAVGETPEQAMIQLEKNILAESPGEVRS